MSVELEDIRLLPPAGDSAKIVLAGLNYRRHAAELAMAVPKEPVIFMKPATSLVAHEGNIVYPKGVTRLDYEAELAVVIGKKARFVSESSARQYILGYTCLNDVTARDLQKKDGQWTRAKSFDSFCPLGPWIETKAPARDAAIKLLLNGKERQGSTIADFIFTVARLVSFISSVMTLLPGDVVSTGTPPGVGAMVPGDSVAVDIEGVGFLRNTVTRARGTIGDTHRA
jgi:2-keto-4-pentenoate hydratase/2-oxohepta-3-ene-1,7-dioic acid hydratase in catechol pathway